MSRRGKSVFGSFEKEGNCCLKEKQGMGYKKVLFVTWDGADVMYLENLFAPVFFGLQERYGYEFHIIQFTNADDAKLRQRKSDLSQRGLRYSGIGVSRRSPLGGILTAKYWHLYTVKRYVETHGIEILMPRAVNSFFIIKSLVKKSSVKLVFDADGFPLDERVDFAGLSPKSWRYRFFRDVEFSGFHRADSILCRSQKAKEIIVSRAGAGFDSQKVVVINNGTFVPLASESPKGTNRVPTLIYAGSVGPQYMLDEMIGTFGMVLAAYPDARFRLLTFRVEEIRAYVSDNFPRLSPSIEIKSVPAEKVMEELKSADIALSFRKSSFSMQSVAPIKIAEYLGAGLSVLYTSGTGDVDGILGHQPFAFRMDFAQGVEPKPFLDWVKEQIERDYSQDVCRFASKVFSLQETVDLYHRAMQYGHR